MPEKIENCGITGLLGRDIDKMTFDEATGFAQHLLTDCSGPDALLVLKDLKQRDLDGVGPDLILKKTEGGNTMVTLEEGSPDGHYKRTVLGLIRADGTKQISVLPTLTIENPPEPPVPSGPPERGLAVDPVERAQGEITPEIARVTRANELLAQGKSVTVAVNGPNQLVPAGLYVKASQADFPHGNIRLIIDPNATDGRVLPDGSTTVFYHFGGSSGGSGGR
jgi:hypothetical protein